MRKEGKSTRYALVCFYISSFAYSRARFKSFTRTFGKNFCVRSREGKRKTDKQHPNRFFIIASRKDLKFPPIREGEKRKRIAGKRRRQFSSLEDFSCVRVWWLFRFKRTTKRTFSESWISFSLSVKSVKTRTAFLPDLGSILPYFEGKKGGVLESQLGEKKQTTKIHHRFKASHYRERLLSDLTFTDSFIKHSRFAGPLLSCKHHSIDSPKKRRTRKEFVVAKKGDCLLGASVKFQSGKKERL